MRPFKIYRYKAIWPYILSALFLTVFVSCGSDSPIIDTEPEEEGIYASIVLAGQNIGVTRAGVGEDTQDTNGMVGSSAENYINKDDLYVLTFSIPSGSNVLTDQSELLEVIWSPTVSERNPSSAITSNGEQILLRTMLSTGITEYSKGNFCIVALSNIANFNHSSSEPAFSLEPGTTTFGSLRNSAIYTYAGKNDIWSWKPDMAAKTGIPMFGVKRVSIQGYDKTVHNEGNPFPLTSNGNSVVWMLRAFAKVNISIADELKQMVIDGEKVNVSIESADISNQYGSEFQLIPDPERMQGFISSGGTGQVVIGPDYSEWFVKDGPENSKLSFCLTENKDGAFIYLPEYPLTDSKPKIKIRLKVNGNVIEREFLLKEYPPSGTSTSEMVWWKYILRNHSYRYSITLDYRIVSVQPTEWDDAFDNFFEFGSSANEN